MASSVTACRSVAVRKPFVATRASSRPAKLACRAALLPSQQAVEKSMKAGMAGMAAALLMVLPSSAGPLSDMLPDSAPAPPAKLFERDLGEGRKLKVDSADELKDTSSRLPAPLPFKKAERASPSMTAEGDRQPGIPKDLAADSTAAPLTSGGAGSG